MDPAAPNELREELLGEQGRLMSGCAPSLRSLVKSFIQQASPLRMRAAHHEPTKNTPSAFSCLALKNTHHSFPYGRRLGGTAAPLHQGLLGTSTPLTCGDL